MAPLPPQPDAVTNRPSEADLSRFSTLLDRYKKRILDPDSGERPILAKYGWLVIDHLGLRTDEILHNGVTGEAVQKVYEEIGQRFLELCLPDHDDLSKYDAKHVAEYILALDTIEPEPGRLSAAFGAARLNHFGKDLRLVYRAGGYLGKRGNLLADYLIANVFPIT